MIKKLKILFRISLFFSVFACAPLETKKVGVNYTWKNGDTIESVSKKYNVDSFALRQYNDLFEPEDIVPGKIIIIPKAPDQLIETPNYPVSGQGHSFIWPSPGRLSSKYGPRWGRMHYGIDLTSSRGRSIIAAESGLVVFAGTRSGFGKTIVIEHGNDLRSLYAHNSKIYVKKGQSVRKAERISEMGRTGRSTGIHLHFELHKNRKPVNPLSYLPNR